MSESSKSDIETFAVPMPEPQSDGPDVSVLMAVYNGRRYLEEAMHSITSQTLLNIEIVVVDDCSTDDTPDILARLAAEDPRIRVITAPRNLRLAGALNLGLDHVRAPLVARMDHDDISLPKRLEVQKRFMDAHPEVTLLGSSIDWIDENGAFMRRSVRRRDAIAVRWTSRFSINVPHPTFMFRTRLPNGAPLRYDDHFTMSEDYELLSRLTQSPDIGIVCLPDVLLRYRFHADSVSRAKFAEQCAEAGKAALRFQQETLPPALVDALAPLRGCFFHLESATPGQIAACFRAARAMLAHDLALYPDRAPWLRRQTAQFLFWALQRGGASRSTLIAAFLRHGPDLLIPLGLRVLETQGLLPAALHSDPDVRSAMGGR